MAIEYQNKAESFVGTAAISITISAPDGFSAGDLLVAFISKDDDDAIIKPAGWTDIELNSTDANRFNSYYRIAEAGDTNWSWTGDNEEWYGVILRYTGQDTSAPFYDSGFATGDGVASIDCPSVAYVDLPTGSLCIQCFGCDDDDTPYTTSGSLSERFNGVSSIGSGTCGAAGGDKIISGTDSTGIATFTMDAADEMIGQTIIFKASREPLLAGFGKMISTNRMICCADES